MWANVSPNQFLIHDLDLIGAFENKEEETITILNTNYMKTSVKLLYIVHLPAFSIPYILS